MNCSEAKSLLSSYYDGELTADSRALVAQHLETCPNCANELQSFARLSEMAQGLSSPNPPEGMWGRLEDQLDHPIDGEQIALPPPSGSRMRLYSGLSALAAGIVVVAAVMWYSSRPVVPPTDIDPFAKEFAQYLRTFQDDPAAAQEFLLAKYEHHQVSANEALEKVGYRPAVADGLPEDLTVDSMYVMKMPCCTCVETVCKRRDGSTVAIFEHNDDEPEWFDSRPNVNVKCNGKSCCLAELDGHFAASWKQDNRYLTMIGLRDIDELHRMVSSFESQEKAEPAPN